MPSLWLFLAIFSPQRAKEPDGKRQVSGLRTARGWRVDYQPEVATSGLVLMAKNYAAYHDLATRFTFSCQGGKAGAFQKSEHIILPPHQRLGWKPNSCCAFLESIVSRDYCDSARTSELNRVNHQTDSGCKDLQLLSGAISREYLVCCHGLFGERRRFPAAGCWESGAKPKGKGS